MSGAETARWRRVQALCDAVEALPPLARLPRLHELESDEALRREVLELLDAIDEEARAQEAHAKPPVARPVVADSPLPATIGGVRIEARLGAGGSGEVYRGIRRTNATEQKVAVKLFHIHRVTADDFDRFAREQQALATLTHPAIVRFFDAGTTSDGRPYLVMELAEGQSISAYCDERALPVPARLRLFLRVCEGVISAHTGGVLHLDLKPSNVIVAGQANASYVKLVDFGTAKLIGTTLEATRTAPLTIQYASPERLRGDAVTAACDVYSLGLILFELLAGRWPFTRSDSIVAAAERAAGIAAPMSLASAVTDEAARLRQTTAAELRSQLAGKLEAIVAKALAHEPLQRYGSVDELAADVRRYLDREPVRARPASAWGRMPRVRRRLALAITGAAIVAAGAGIAWYASSRVAPAAPAPPPILPIPAGGDDYHTSMVEPRQARGSTVVDDFVLTEQSSITGVSWRGTYCSREILTQPPAPVATAFTIAFYADSPGGPDRDFPIWLEAFPIAGVEQTLVGMRMGRCGADEQTAYGYYHHSVRFSKPFVASPGTYWIGVQAKMPDQLDPTRIIYWGWGSGRSTNNRSIQFAPNGLPRVFSRDRQFTLAR